MPLPPDNWNRELISFPRPRDREWVMDGTCPSLLPGVRVMVYRMGDDIVLGRPQYVTSTITILGGRWGTEGSPVRIYSPGRYKIDYVTGHMEFRIEMPVDSNYSEGCGISIVTNSVRFDNQVTPEEIWTVRWADTNRFIIDGRAGISGPQIRNDGTVNYAYSDGPHHHQWWDITSPMDGNGVPHLGRISFKLTGTPTPGWDWNNHPIRIHMHRVGDTTSPYWDEYREVGGASDLTNNPDLLQEYITNIINNIMYNQYGCLHCDPPIQPSDDIIIAPGGDRFPDTCLICPGYAIIEADNCSMTEVVMTDTLPGPMCEFEPMGPVSSQTILSGQMMYTGKTTIMRLSN